jgi:hypothetical protein
MLVYSNRMRCAGQPDSTCCMDCPCAAACCAPQRAPQHTAREANVVRKRIVCIDLLQASSDPTLNWVDWWLEGYFGITSTVALHTRTTSRAPAYHEQRRLSSCVGSVGNARAASAWSNVATGSARRILPENQQHTRHIRAADRHRTSECRHSTSHDDPMKLTRGREEAILMHGAGGWRGKKGERRARLLLSVTQRRSTAQCTKHSIQHGV